jgi:hypothetical protein
VVAKDAVAGVSCRSCGDLVLESEIRTCMICRSRFCPQCAVVGFGREFCSPRCREFFFHGEEPDDQEVAE